MEKGKLKQPLSWFWKWFLNNKVVTGLLVLLLVLLNIMMFSKISYIFEPIGQFFSIIGLPLIMSGILYYLFNPVIDYFEAKKVPRSVSIVIVFLLIIGIIIWGVATLVPLIREQTMSFVSNLPSYWEQISHSADQLMKSDTFEQFQDEFSKLNTDIFKTITDKVTSTLNSTVNGIGNLLGAVTNVLIALITTPFILFYLLKDGHQLPNYLKKFIPVKMQHSSFKVLHEMNKQVSQYIRGQLIVAFSVAIMFIIGYAVIGMDYGITLGILAGVLNLIPYLGSFLAMVPAIILGLVISPIMLVKVLILFMIEQTIEGRFISPLILGSNLEIHPVTIIIVLLTSGKLFGITGVILGIPGYAVLKVLATHIFEWHKETSGLYDEQEDKQLLLETEKKIE
ncbi:AI-2E family transporter [Isobaculum melis]|uniref:Predicted PurR-regulated permease PerM n=1 Tax=Isobaculum melis TaxID=142588 RepID=A0A1H9UAD4_9LACT|nr:AI-2E family transporter [Isobaculum melis]SES06319.1 Predicted PurR-regulated permease PerM [Isobaculum melis]